MERINIIGAGIYVGTFYDCKPTVDYLKYLIKKHTDDIVLKKKIKNYF